MYKILTNLDFDVLLSESLANTQTGSDLIDKYRSFLMANPVSFQLVNNFIREARYCTYDNGVNHILEQVADYVNSNKTLWALATACESINNNNSSHNYLNKNAAKQVQHLLEVDEDTAIKYIKAGALKNVMFCEAFRNIAKQVYKNQPIVEAAADYTIIHPISLVENVGDGVCFTVMGNLYKLGDDKTIQESQWNEVSNEFKNISRLLNSNIVKIDEHTISISAGNSIYEISKQGECVKKHDGKSQTLTLEQLRDNNRLVLMTSNPSKRNIFAGILESIAQLCENYDNVVNLDNATIYNTANDSFLVIESADKLYATLLKSNRHPKWTINESAMDAITFIKSKTNVSLSEVYKNAIDNDLNNASEKEQEKIEEELKNQEIQSYRTRIENLTEKFKNDPIKLALLSKIAHDLNECSK